MTTLKAALQEACFMELEDIPSEEELSADESLTFSVAFERKMKKLIRRTDHPIRYQVAQAAACILLAALLSGCAVLTISPEARAAFVGWIRETYETWFVYRYVGENKGNSEDISYYPAWIPDGYYETSRFDTDTYTTIIYEDNNNNIITFYYTYDADAAGIYLEQEGVDVKSVLIGNIFADLYLDEIEENANSLVWVDEKSGVLFCISANCNEEELIKIAESVEAQEIPKP